MHWSRFASAAGVCVLLAACTDAPTTPRPLPRSAPPLFSVGAKPERIPVDFVMGTPAARPTAARAQAAATLGARVLGEIQVDADIDCGAVFTSLTTCRETYALEAESNQGVTRAEGHLHGRRLARDGATTTVYELDAKIDCLTMQPYAASAGEPAGVDIWVSGPVRKYTMNGKAQPIPGGNTDVIVQLRRSLGADRRENGLGSLLYAYVSDGCATMTPLPVMPRASIQLELRKHPNESHDPDR